MFWRKIPCFLAQSLLLKSPQDDELIQSLIMIGPCGGRKIGYAGYVGCDKEKDLDQLFMRYIESCFPRAASRISISHELSQSCLSTWSYIKLWRASVFHNKQTCSRSVMSRFIKACLVNNSENMILVHSQRATFRVQNVPQAAVVPTPWSFHFGLVYNYRCMTLFSIENLKSLNLVLTPHASHRISIIHHTECQVLVHSQ